MRSTLEQALFVLAIAAFSVVALLTGANQADARPRRVHHAAVRINRPFQPTRHAHMARRGATNTRLASRASEASTGTVGASVVAEARRWIGGNPTGLSSLWCARFMNFVLKRVGRHGTGSDMARSFATYGRRLSGPQVGAIAVMARRGGGHVGVVSGFDRNGNPRVISGNHGHHVAESVYSKGRIYAYVAPGA